MVITTKTSLSVRFKFRCKKWYFTRITIYLIASARPDRQISYEITNIVYSGISLIKTYLHRNFNNNMRKPNISIALELIRVFPNDSIIIFRILSRREMLKFATTARHNLVIMEVITWRRVSPLNQRFVYLFCGTRGLLYN